MALDFTGLLSGLTDFFPYRATITTKAPNGSTTTIATDVPAMLREANTGKPGTFQREPMNTVDLISLQTSVPEAKKGAQISLSKDGTFYKRYTIDDIAGTALGASRFNVSPTK